MGFGRVSVIALLQNQEDKNKPVKSIEGALELLIKGDNGYRHEFVVQNILGANMINLRGQTN